MFRKMKLKHEIKKNCDEIEVIEKKRYRSQSALVEAILKSETPDDQDVEYFNKYTAEIEKLRREIRAMKKEIESL